SPYPITRAHLVKTQAHHESHTSPSWEVGLRSKPGGGALRTGSPHPARPWPSHPPHQGEGWSLVRRLTFTRYDGFMHLDAVDLKDFYACRLGLVVRGLLGSRLRGRWGDLKSCRSFGLGFATPYLAAFRGEAEPLGALMPA